MGPALALLLVVVPHTTSGTDNDAHVAAARSFYAAVAAVHVEADVRVTKDGVSGLGTFQYWADGEKYRVNCTMPADRLGIMSDVQVAFDGRQFQLYHAAADVLSLFEGDRPTIPTAVPNPFFLPVDYLSKDSDACPACQLKLQNLRAPFAALPTRTREQARLSPRLAEDKIEWLNEAGAVNTVIQFDRPLDRGFPRRIVLQDRDPGGRVSAEIEYRISVIETNVPIAPSVFTIPRETALHVVGEDGVLQRP